LRRVGSGLLVAHADIGNAFFLRGCGDVFGFQLRLSEQEIAAGEMRPQGHVAMRSS